MSEGPTGQSTTTITQRAARGSLSPAGERRPLATAREGAESHRAPSRDSLAVAEAAPLDLRHRKRLPQDEMDMTPMVDVTFLLLIFFMVTASFALQKSLELPTPRESETTTAPKTLDDFENDPLWIVVRIDSLSTFHVLASDFDKETPSRHELLVQLRLARQGNREGVIPTRMLVAAHGDARHEQVVTAMDAGTAIGLEEVKLITVEEDF